MIPRTIHYCWFGKGEKPKLALKCIESWKKYCPDFKIIEWNESNFDVNQNGFTQYCYINKKWAFLSDYVRLFVIEKYGGIYFDTDVEVVKSFEPLLNNSAFYGFETKDYINTGLGFGAEAGHETVRALKAEYDKLTPDSGGDYPLVNCPKINTEVLETYGLKRNGLYQMINNAAFFPAEYFNPYDDPTGRLNKTENTYSIHWYSKSWMSRKKVIRSIIMKPIHRIFGVDILKKH